MRFFKTICILCSVLLIVFILCGLPKLTHAETRLTAPLFTGTVTFTKESSPYILDGDTLFDSGSTWVVEPGAVIMAATSTTFSFKPFITTRGNVDMKGTEAEPIQISGFSRMIMYGNNKLEHVVVGKTPIRVTSMNLFPVSTSIDSSSFSGADMGLEIQKGTVSIKDSVVKNNRVGIMLSQGGNWDKVSVLNSVFENNASSSIQNLATKQADAFMNWWGNENGPGYSVVGPVLTSPWLTSDPRVPVVKVASCCSNVLFVPGLEASRLYRDDKDLLGGGTTTHRAWEPYTNVDVKSLFLSATGESLNPTIKANGVIDSAYGLKPIYKNFIATLDGLRSKGIFKEWSAYPYDWRMAVQDVVNDTLVGEVERLASTSKTGKVTVVAHSNGGLVAKLLGRELEKRGESALVDRVLLVAVPQLGTPQAVAALLHGAEQELLGGVVMKASTARDFGLNMSGSYGLLPSQEFFSRITEPVITFADKVLGSFDVFKSFMTGADGRMLPASNDLKTPAVLSKDLLGDAEVLHGSLDSWKFPTPTETLTLAGWGVPTTKAIDYSSSTPRLKKSIEGDGTVIVGSAAAGGGPTLYFNQGLYNFDQHLQSSHTDILEVGVVKNFLTDILSTTTLTAHNMYSSYLSNEKPTTAMPWNKWLTVSVHSPVDLDIYDGKGGHMGLTPLPPGDLSWFENTIGGTYDLIGDEKYYTIPSDGTYNVKLKGTGAGNFTFQVQKFAGTDMAEVGNIVYADIPVTPLLEASTTITGTSYSEALNLDVDGNGTTDLKTEAHSSADPLLNLETIRVLVTALNLDRNEEKQLLKRIDKIKALLLTDKKDLLIKKLKAMDEKVDLGHWSLKNLTETNRIFLTSMLDSLLLILETT